MRIISSYTRSTHCRPGCSRREICFFTRRSKEDSGMNSGCRTPLELAIATWMSWSRMVSKGCTAIRRRAKTWGKMITSWCADRPQFSSTSAYLIEQIHDASSAAQLFHLHAAVASCTHIISRHDLQPVFMQRHWRSPFPSTKSFTLDAKRESIFSSTSPCFATVRSSADSPRDSRFRCRNDVRALRSHDSSTVGAASLSPVLRPASPWSCCESQEGNPFRQTIRRSTRGSSI